MSLFRKAGLAGIVVLFTATCADAQTMANHHGNMAGAMDPTQMMTDQPTAAGATYRTRSGRLRNHPGGRGHS